MRSIEQAVEVGVDGLAPIGQIGQDGFVTSIALISPQPGDSASDSLGPIGGAALDDLGVEGLEFTVVETNGDLGGHTSKTSNRVNQLVCNDSSVASPA